MRCFLAIELDATVRSMLCARRDTLRTLEPAWAGEKWVAGSLMHITVKFLGELDDSAVDAPAGRVRDSRLGSPRVRTALWGYPGRPAPEVGLDDLVRSDRIRTAFALCSRARPTT